jgi:hypothetical protein
MSSQASFILGGIQSIVILFRVSYNTDLGNLKIGIIYTSQREIHPKLPCEL